jgi:hypothetical protein
VRRREHVRGRGAAIVGTSGDLPSAASEKGRTKVAKPRGNSAVAAWGCRPAGARRATP